MDAPKDGGPGTLGRKLGEANSPLVLHVGFAAEAEAAPARADSEAVRGWESESRPGAGAAACTAAGTVTPARHGRYDPGSPTGAGRFGAKQEPRSLMPPPSEVPSW